MVLVYGTSITLEKYAMNSLMNVSASLLLLHTGIRYDIIAGRSLQVFCQ